MQWIYYDLHINSNHSIGTSSVAEIIRQAERLELHTIAITDQLETKAEFDNLRAEAAAASPKIQVLLGVEIKAENAAEMIEKVNKWRDVTDIIVVAGGNVDVNKAACSDGRVNILAHPERKRKDSGLDYVLAAEAAKNGVAIELNFREYLQTYGKLRSHILAHMRTNAMLATHYKAPLIVNSGAQSRWEMRAGRELAALANICGLDREQAVRAVTLTPQDLVAKIRAAKTPGRIAPGVEVTG